MTRVEERSYDYVAKMRQKVTSDQKMFIFSEANYLHKLRLLSNKVPTVRHFFFL